MKNIFNPKPVSVSYKNIDLRNPKKKAKLITQLRKKNVDALGLSNSKVQLDKEILEAIKNRSTNNNAESTKIYNISIWDEMNAADGKIHELKLAGNDDNSDSVSE